MKRQMPEFAAPNIVSIFFAPPFLAEAIFFRK
jgi:hypothetical protein